MVERIREGDIPGVQLRRRLALPLTAEQTWLWLTEPDRASRWLADSVEMTGDSGDILLLESSLGEATFRERGVVEEVVPLRLWSLSFERLEADWRALTRLVFEIRVRDAGSELSVLHEGFQRLPLSQCLTIWEAYRHRWQAALDRLRQVAATDP